MSTFITKKEILDLIIGIRNCFELEHGYMKVNKYGSYIRFNQNSYVQDVYKRILNSINSGKITYNIYNDIYLFLQTLRNSLLNIRVVVTKRNGYAEIEIAENAPSNKNTFNNLFPNVQKNYQNQIIKYNLIDLLRKTLVEVKKVRVSV
jgi:hypothetical protein